MVRDLTPLGIVQHDLVQHTSRNPSGVEAVMSTIRDAVATLGHEQASDFSQRLVHSLDPHVRGGLGVSGAEALEKLGELAANPQAERSERWGATSLLGVLAMTHKPDADQLAPENFRTQTASTIARTALTQLIYSESAEPEQVAAAEAFLARTDVSTEDVATELHVEGFADAFTPVPDKEAFLEPPTEEAEILMGSHTSEPFAYILPELTTNTQNKLKAMHWIYEGAEKDTHTARKIFKDGVHIATLVDLTSCHGTFAELHAELASDKTKYAQFWSQMTAAIVRRCETKRAKMVRGTDVTMYYMANKAHSSAQVVRGYYVGFGQDKDGITPLYALVAAFRTKANQSKVLRIVSDGKSSCSES